MLIFFGVCVIPLPSRNCNIFFSFSLPLPSPHIFFLSIVFWPLGVNFLPSPLLLLLFFPGIAFYVFFKKCSHCEAKLSSSDGQDFCLFCWGESHKVDSCAHCTRFTKQAQYNREVQLRNSLLENALNPSMASDM